MDRGTVARIEDWESRPFAGGHDGLRDLADRNFSGAITTGSAWLFVLNGRVIGASGGSLDAFADADGTAYVAPHESLPLLFAMRERGGETRARYYTDDTPLAEVDRTLSDGNFTGFVELSENVLSGDYYMVYYGGQSMSAAFIGSEERLITGDEAFERANDEIGIYEVRTVELDVREIPEPDSGSSSTMAGAAAPDARSAGAEDGENGGRDGDSGLQSDSDPEHESTPTSGPDPQPDAAAGRSSGPGDDQQGPDDPDQRVPGDPDQQAPGDGDPTPAAGRSASEDGRSGPTDSPVDASGIEHVETSPEPAGSDRSETPDVDAGSERPAVPESEDEDPFSEEEEWREARTIPALDPEETVLPDEVDAAEREQERPGTERTGDAQPERETSDTAERIRELRAAIESYEARVSELEDSLEDATAERDRLSDERDELRRRVGELEDGGDVGFDADEQFDPDDALSRTDVFVRYGSKGKETLDGAHEGNADREAVNENLRLETHTRFDDADVAVDGRPFADFLADSLEHRFVRWVAEELLYEIRDTGSEGRLRDLYDAIPRIDRIEFRGTISTRDEDGEELREPFDVILRDRMGAPLLVADLNDSRDPASSDMMSDLVERATTVADAQESLGGAFLVTASFFEPDALETASEATDAGLLNRDARKSFVKLSRKRGYHLCLVEARGDEFHLAVPEI